MNAACFALAIFAAGAVTGVHAARSRCVPGSLADDELRDLAALCVAVALAASAANAGIVLAGAMP